MSDGGTYHGVFSYRPYGSSSDFSGGPMHQLGFTTNGNLWIRSSTNATTWGDWAKLITSNNLGTVNGTLNYVAKFTDPNSLGNSQIFDNGTNVGIGTTSPSSKLHVNGSVRFQGLGTGTQTTSLMVDASGNVTSRSLNITNWDNAYSWGDHAAAGYLTSFSEVDPTWNGSANQTGAIGRTGNVGIGTTSPTQKLHVEGVSTLGDGTVSSPASTSTLLIPASGTAGTQRTYIELMGVYANDATNENGGGFIKFRTSTAANYGPEIGGIRRSGGTGDFLIRTGGSSPQERLRVFDNGTVQISNLSGTGTSIVFADANGNLSVGTGSSLFSAGNGLSWSETTLNSVWTESGNNIYNNNTGNVGIGTTAPDERLHVVGNTKVSTLSGTGNRMVYADASGVLKAGTGNDNTNWTLSANFSYSPDDLWGHGGTSGGTLSGDDATASYTMPFSLTIEGTSYSSLTISTNGWVTFGSVSSSYYSNSSLPTSTFSVPVICAYWDDLVAEKSNIRYGYVGTSPNRTIIIDYEADTWSGDYDVRFQVQIHEGSGLINIKYRHEMYPNANGQSATIGFQLAGGSSAKAYPISYNGKVLDDNRDDSEGWSVCPVR